MDPLGAAFCVRCGSRAERRIPAGDNRERATCGKCGFIHYDNPRPVAGAIVVHEGSILLCRRAIEPRVGYWTTPGGFQEVGESTQEAARRETVEEACAQVRIEGLHALLDIEHLGQTYSIFRGSLVGDFGVGVESQETRLFRPDELPWDEMAFPVLTLALRWYVDETATGERHVHTGSVSWDGTGERWDVERYLVKGHLRQPLR